MQAATLNNDSPTYFQDRADIAEAIRTGRYQGEVLRKAACTLAACTMPMSVEDLGGEDDPAIRAEHHELALTTLGLKRR